MKLFEDLEWGPAFKRAAFLVAFWLLALYVLTVAFPETFVLGLDSSAGAVAAPFSCGWCLGWGVL